MTAKNGDTVKVHYTGKLDDGQIFDSSDGGDPLEFTLGAGSIIEGFDAAVQGMSVGESKEVRIPAVEAYGERVDEMVIGVSREQLPKGMEPEIGQMLELVTEEGERAQLVITAFDETSVTLDGNHPLAGYDLTFAIKLVEIA
ncbi:MAG: peptidylprolyl isomerase [Thermoanaerobaculia bacterium]|nr:peptidylprolyl isomerase [Thermoanaerobaculia bacterium]